MNAAPARNNRTEQTDTPLMLYLIMGWQTVVALAMIALSVFIFQLNEFANLGRPVQYFAGVAVLIPAGMGFLSNLWLLQRNNRGRYLAMALNFVGFVLVSAAVLSQWGAYQSFERLVDIVLANGWLTLGFAIAYALYWIAGRLDETSRLREWLEMTAVGLSMLTLMAMLLIGTPEFNIFSGVLVVIQSYSAPVTWAVTLVAVVFLAAFWSILTIPRYFKETPAEREAWQGWLMLSPNIIGFMVFFAGPLLLSFYLSFTDSSVGQIPEIIGFANYAELLSLEFITAPVNNGIPQDYLSFGYSVLGEIFLPGDSRLIIGAKDVLFWVSLRNTLVFCIMLLPLSIIPALILSLILNSKLPGMKFYRAIYFLPSVAAVVGTALIWRWLYDPTIGYMNYAITQVVTALNSLGFVGLTDPGIEWLTGPGVVLFSIVLLSAWQVVGYNTVLFLAGLQGIPGVLYEAAQIDGANRWQQFWNVTLPMLAPTTFFVVITTMVTGLQVFNEPYALFPSRPIPTNATTSVYYMYTQGFNEFQFGYASAVAWFLFAIIFSLTLLQFRMNRNEAYG